MNTKKIAIAGSGWLGKQIGTHFRQAGWEVFASYRRPEHAEELIKMDLIPYELSIDDQGGSNLMDLKITNVDLFVICIPPFRKEEPAVYANALSSVVRQLSDDTKVIFIGSTGIYPQKEGIYDESYSFSEEDKRTSLYRAEAALRSMLGTRLTILRSGGLIGPGRHPIQHLSGKKMDTDGSAPVTLIHSNDVCRVVQWIDENDLYGEILNLYYPLDMTKRQYYEWIAKNSGMQPPIYSNVPDIQRKILSVSGIVNTNFLHENITDISQPFNDHYVK